MIEIELKWIVNGIKIKFNGEGVNEVGIVEQCNNPDYTALHSTRTCYN